MTPSQRSPRALRTAVLGASAVLAAAGTTATALALTGSGGGPAAASAPARPRTTPSAPSTAQPVADPSEEPQPTAAATPLRASSTHLRIAGVGLDVPVLPLGVPRGVINPPTLREAYWIQSYGRPGPHPDDTVYIAAHSWSRGNAAFNPLMDRAAQVSTVRAGDVVEVDTAAGDTRYTVTGTRTYAKGRLPATSAVWEDHPGRLVLITCFQRADGRPTTDNLVITAETSSGPNRAPSARATVPG